MSPIKKTLKCYKPVISSLSARHGLESSENYNQGAVLTIRIATTSFLKDTAMANSKW